MDRQSVPADRTERGLAADGNVAGTNADAGVVVALLVLAPRRQGLGARE